MRIVTDSFFFLFKGFAVSQSSADIGKASGSFIAFCCCLSVGHSINTVPVAHVLYGNERPIGLPFVCDPVQRDEPTRLFVGRYFTCSLPLGIGVVMIRIAQPPLPNTKKADLSVSLLHQQGPSLRSGPDPKE